MRDLIFGLMPPSERGMPRNGKEKYVYFLILLTGWAMAGCHRHAAIPGATGSEGLEVTVVNLAGTSGCQFILRPDSGADLIPVTGHVPDHGWVQEGRYRITCQDLRPPVYACTADGRPVEILSVTALEAMPPEGTGGIRPEVQPCADVRDPFQVPWMVRVMDQVDPDQVTRFRANGTLCYGFRSGQASYVFDCRGERICRCPSEDRICDRIQEPGDVILVKNHTLEEPQH